MKRRNFLHALCLSPLALLRRKTRSGTRYLPDDEDDFPLTLTSTDDALWTVRHYTFDADGNCTDIS